MPFTLAIFLSFWSLATGNTPFMASDGCINHFCGPVFCSRFWFRCPSFCSLSVVFTGQHHWTLPTSTSSPPMYYTKLKLQLLFFNHLHVYAQVYQRNLFTTCYTTRRTPSRTNESTPATASHSLPQPSQANSHSCHSFCYLCLLVSEVRVLRVGQHWYVRAGDR